jgi:hypothetical protein
MGLYSVLNQEIMRISYLFLFLLLNISVIKGQDYPEFSDLSSNKSTYSGYFSSIEVNGGYLYHIYQNDSDYRLFKVNYDGIVIDSTTTFADGYDCGGDLYSINQRIFLIGTAFPPEFINFAYLMENRRNSILEYNQDLDLIGVHLYNTMPYENFVDLSIYFDNSFFQPLTSFHLEGDTMSIIRSYTQLDTLTFISDYTQPMLERVGLNDSVYLVKNLGYNLTYYTGAVITDDKIFANAFASSVGGPVFINFSSIGELTSNGDFVRQISLAPPNAWVDPTVTSASVLINNRIFTSYNDPGFYLPECGEEAAVIDIRDKDFNLLHLAKVPDCGFYPSGTKCFAEQGNKIYFLTRNALGDIGLYQYDTLLNLQWGKIFDFQESHLGISLNSTPDGGCIMECFVGDILKLYKVDCFGNIVSSTQLPIGNQGKISIFPNPFADSFTIEGFVRQIVSVLSLE